MTTTPEVLSESKMQAVYKLIYTLRSSNNIRIGFNEAVKSIKYGTSLLTVIAADAVPLSIVKPLPIISEQKGVPYVYVDSKSALGKACKLSLNAIACTITVSRDEDSARIQDQISQALNK